LPIRKLQRKEEFCELGPRGLYYKTLGICNLHNFYRLRRKEVVSFSHFHLLGQTH
jgi:hypothetical protein